MKKEKKVRQYTRKTKSGKTVIVKAHTAKYDAADKAKEIAKKKGAGDELEERKKKKPIQLEIPFDFDKEGEKKVLDEIKDTEKKSSKKVRPVGSGTNGPTPKKKSEEKSTKKTKTETSEPAFTAAEFKEWYRGTGSAADKKVAKALRAQLGRSGYRKLEDEAIDNYSSRGHLSMFKRVSGGSGGSEAKTKTSLGGKAAKEKDTSKPPKFTVSELKKKGWQKVPIGNRRLDNAEFVGKLFYMVSPDKKQMVEVYSNQGRYLVDYPRQSTKRVLGKLKKVSEETSTKIDPKVVRGYAKDYDISVKDARKELSASEMRAERTPRSKSQRMSSQEFRRFKDDYEAWFASGGASRNGMSEKTYLNRVKKHFGGDTDSWDEYKTSYKKLKKHYASK